MIENNRDEEVCPRWDVLADEDHTYHLSEEEYFYYKNKWWLHLNKSGSDTQPVRKRSDFNHALSTLERLHQEAEQNNSRPFLLELQTMEVGIEFVLYMLRMARLPVVFFLEKSGSQGRGKQSLGKERERLGENLRGWLSRIHSILLQIHRLQLTAVYCNRGEV